jgi:guanylate cyclase
MLGYFVEQREWAHRTLQAERERSERLLLNVLPEPIAERLKVGTG